MIEFTKLLQVAWELEHSESQSVCLERVRQYENSKPVEPDAFLFAIRCGSLCLTKKLEWIAESFQIRDEEFYELCRYENKEQALEYWNKYKAIEPTKESEK